MFDLNSISNLELNPNQAVLGHLLTVIELRDSLTGYLLPVCDAQGTLPDLESCRDAAVAIAVAAAAPRRRRRPPTRPPHLLARTSKV